MDFQPSCWALGAFLFSYSHAQLIGLLGQGISPSEDLYIHTGQHKQIERTDIYASSVF
jgi:hypothetical protein